MSTSILIRIDKQASKFNFEIRKCGAKIKVRKYRMENPWKRRDISRECQHFGVGNENTNLVICDMGSQRPMNDIDGTNSDGNVIESNRTTRNLQQNTTTKKKNAREKNHRNSILLIFKAFVSFIQFQMS